MKFISNAVWHKTGKSTDEHRSLMLAEVACRRLISEYGKGNGFCSVRGVCVLTWVSDEEGKVLTNEEEIRTHPEWQKCIKTATHCDNIWMNSTLGLFTFIDETENFHGYYSDYNAALNAFRNYEP